MKRTGWAPFAAAAAVVVAVVAVVAGGSLIARDGRADGPPVLQLAAPQGSFATDSSFATAKEGGRGTYRLDGKLPTGPTEARLRNLKASAAAASQVRSLASALGETTAPQRSDDSWKTGDLVVSDLPGNPWTWGTGCGPDTPVASDSGGVNDASPAVCGDSTVSSGAGSSGKVEPGTGNPGAIEPDTGSSGKASSGTASSGTVQPDSSTVNPDTSASGTVGACPSPPPGGASIACGEPGVPGPGPQPPKKVLLNDSQALAATARIRDALGLDGSPTRVEGLSVVVEPLAAGLPTNGMATLLQLSTKARLVSATGWLSSGQDGQSYPLRSARSAFDAMPVTALGAPCEVATGCPEGPAITGARLGLSRVALVGGSSALVPAWLFTVQSSPVPLVAIAVADRFLADPDRPRPGQEPGPSTEPGTKPGAPPATQPGIEPGPDGSLPPVPPDGGGPAGPGGREPLRFDGAYADADPKVLVVRYGDSGSCPSQAVRQEVVQEAKRVVVTLTRTPLPKDQACTSDYQAKLVRVPLAVPLDGREVIDGSRNTTVPLSTGSPPFG